MTSKTAISIETYEIVSVLIQSCLAERAVNFMSEYQCGSVKGRLTINSIHALKQIMEKAQEYRTKLEMFIDFQQAFGSVKRNVLLQH